MSESYQLDVPIEEALPLNSVPGTGVQQPEDTGNQVICVGEDSPESCCSDKYHRKLAISSIICGFSCFGVRALIYSVKVSYFLCRQATCSKPAFENFLMRISMFIFDKHLIYYISLQLYTSHSSCLLGMIFKSKVLSHLYFTRLRMLTKQRKPNGQEKGELQSI